MHTKLQSTYVITLGKVTTRSPTEVIATRASAELKVAAAFSAYTDVRNGIQLVVAHDFAVCRREANCKNGWSDRGSCTWQRKRCRRKLGQLRLADSCTITRLDLAGRHTSRDTYGYFFFRASASSLVSCEEAVAANETSMRFLRT